MTSQVPGKHGRGGQSQRRFERLTEIAAHEWFVKCGEKASEIFQTEENLNGILIGGSGPTKQYFIEENYLHYEVQDKVIDVFDTGYTDEYGLRELVDKAAETMTDLKISAEKKVMKQFLREITQTKGSRAIYGEAQVRKALDMGIVETLLISEDLRKYRMTFKCSSCGETKIMTLSEEQLEEFENPECSKCKTSNQMELIEKIDMVDELSDLAEKTSTKVLLVSRNSEEGDSLYRAFNGIAGILRYAVDF
jgi:peptide chain release factor subunit 1